MNHRRDRHWPGILNFPGMTLLSNWPGRIGFTAVGPATGRWAPTDFGPGEGPDLSDSVSAYLRLTASELTSRSDMLCRAESDAEIESETSESRQAGNILRNRSDHLCPSCGYAKMRVDADLHVSCPICGFGVHRS